MNDEPIYIYPRPRPGDQAVAAAKAEARAAAAAKAEAAAAAAATARMLDPRTGVEAEGKLLAAADRDREFSEWMRNRPTDRSGWEAWREEGRRRGLVEQRAGFAYLDSIPTGPPPPLLLDRLDPEGGTILFGPGGVGKGALTCWWLVQLVQLGHRPLILDFENHPGEWARRIGSLDRDAPPLIVYHQPDRPLREEANDLRDTCDALGVTIVVVDSAVPAAGDDPLKPETARAYADGVKRLNRPVLSLAHITKLDDARYPFGSVFWANLARVTWSLMPDGDAALLVNRKANNYARQPALSVVMTWQDGELREVWERSRVASLADEIADLLLDRADLTVPQIVSELSTDERRVSRDSVRAALTRDTGPLGRFTVSDNKWRLRE